MLCWSHKQGAWDQRGVFHMYGDKHQPWVTIRFGSILYLPVEDLVEYVRYTFIISGDFIVSNLHHARLWYWEEEGTVDLWAYFLTAR